MPLHFHLDEHVAGAIAEALRRRGLDVTTTADADLLGATDMQHLEFARAQRRTLYTNDPDFLILSAAGHEHFGIAFCEAGSRPVAVIEMLLLMDACFTTDEMRNKIEFI